MDFSSDSDYSDGSTGISNSVFISSTPKRVLKRQERHLRSRDRIISPVMPKKLDGYRSDYRSDGESMICNGDVRMRKPKYAKVIDLKHHRMSCQVPLKSAPLASSRTRVSNLTLADECESDSPSFQCKICGKGFYHESAVRAHELLHTSTLPRKKMFR